jgi:hypothetical protein
MADEAKIKVTADTSDAESKFGKLGGVIANVGKIAAATAIGGVVALTAGIAKSVSVAAEFETGMNNFSAAAGKALEESGKSAKEFQDLFLDLGKKLPVSTMEVADAATALVKGGLEPAVIAAGGLESSLKFAAAAQMDLTAAAEVGIKQLAIFTDVTASAEEKTKFLAMSQDLLVKAAGASTTDVAQLSDAILMSAGQAKAAGLNYEDFVTSITMVADKMPSAAEAGTSFKNMLMRLNPTTEKAKSAMAELGLVSFDTSKAINVLAAVGVDASKMSMTQMIDSMIKFGKSTGMSKKEISEWVDQMNRSAFYDAEGKFVGMRKAAELMQGALKGLTDEQKTQALQTIFGNDAMGAASALIDGGTAAYDKYTKAIGDANGVNEQSAATQKGLAFMIEQFNGSMEALAITVGTKVLPFVTRFLDEFVMPAVNGFIDLVSNTDSLGGAMDGLAGSLGPAMDGVKKVITDVVTGIQTNWPLIQATIKSVIEGVVAFINDPLVPTFNKILEVVKGLVAWWQTNWPLIQPIITDVINAIVSIINDPLIPVFGFVIEAAKKLIEFIAQHWPEIKQVIDFVVNAVKTKLKEYEALIMLAFDQAQNVAKWMGALKDTIVLKWEEIKAWVGNLPAAFVTAGQNIIQGLINGVVSKLKAFGDLWEKLSSDPINTLKDVMNMHSPSQVMFDAGENIMKGLIYGIQNYRNKAVSVMEQTAQAVTDAAAGVYQTPVGIINTAAGDDSHDRRGSALTSTMAAAGNAMTGTMPQQFNATMNINVVMDGAVLASTVISIVQGILQQEKARYGQP